jgi:hypothetical protein
MEYPLHGYHPQILKFKVQLEKNNLQNKIHISFSCQINCKVAAIEYENKDQPIKQG